MMTEMEMEELQYQLGAELGDPRRCPRHPNVKTSSNDGMFDAPCNECEGEMADAAAEAEWLAKTPEERAAIEAECARMDAEREAKLRGETWLIPDAGPDADILF